MGGIAEEWIAYAIAHSEPEPPLLIQLRQETQERTSYPQMLSGPLVGCVLKMLIRFTRARRVLEVGTFTGYATLWMASALTGDDREIDTIDRDAGVLEIARRYFRESGLDSRIRVHQGDALALLREGAFSGKDFIFLDADKERYPDYLPLLLDLLEPGGVLVADNVLWSGKVLDSGVVDPETDGIRRFNRLVTELGADYFRCLLPIRDGLMVVQKPFE